MTRLYFVYNEETKNNVPECVTHVKIDPSVKEIHNEAFRSRRELVEVEFSEGLERIGDSAFRFCAQLKAMISFPPLTLTAIDTYAFEDCRSLDQPLDFYCEGRGRLRHIGSSAFKRCSALTHLHLPSSLEFIGPFAFSMCTQLSSVHFQDVDDDKSSLREIEGLTFLKCHSLSHFRCPSGVTRIRTCAFSKCRKLLSLELPKGLEMIDADGWSLGPNELAASPNFLDCPSLVNVVIPPDQSAQFLEPGQFLLRPPEWKLHGIYDHLNDLIDKLQHRFDDLPIHRLCYYQSYYPLSEVTEKIQKALKSANPLIADSCDRVDCLGMTPFHILALSQTTNVRLFQTLVMNLGDDRIRQMIRTKDMVDGGPLLYLLKNHSQESTKAIRLLLEILFEPRLRQRALVRWMDGIEGFIDDQLNPSSLSAENAISLMLIELMRYVRLESISLLELALWKAKIDDYESCPDTIGKPSVDRESCRINSGADVIIPNALLFLGDTSCLHLRLQGMLVE